MGMPALLTANATGTTGTCWVPDWMQTPFVIGIAGTITGGGQYAVEYTPNDLNSQGSGTTPGNATWIAVTGLSAATTSPLGVNFTTPCGGFRISIASATATTVVNVFFTQATFPR